MTCHEKVYQLFLYMPHTKKIKVINKIQYFVVYTKKTLSILLHIIQENIDKTQLKSLTFY